MTKQERELEKVIKPIVENLGYTLYDVEYLKEGKEWFLRVYIDSPKGIDLDDCEKVNEPVSDMLDELDQISESYSLEISSCGLERRLREKKHYEEALNKNIEVKLYKHLNKEKTICGKLNRVTDDKVSILKDNNEEIEIEFENIANAKILFNWEE